MKLGVFDSGVGGLSVARAIKTAFSEHEVVLREDTANLPYGTKTNEELSRLVTPILLDMQEQGCELIVIACNTVTTNIITDLRRKITVPLIGTEPMVKSASEQTKSKTIAVFATPGTLRSERYAWLKRQFASDLEVLEPDCSTWAQMIEHNAINIDEITSVTHTCLNAKADVLVLGCTHYHWIEEEIRHIAGDRAIVLQPEQAIIAQLRRVLAPLA